MAIERAKSVSPLVMAAIELLATRECTTKTDAAARVGMTREGLSKALKKPHVIAYMQQRIVEGLGLSAVRAERRVAEIMENDSNLMAAFNATRFALAVGAGIRAEQSQAPVNVNVAVGYVIKLKHIEQDGPLGAVVDVKPAVLSG
jgi:hypothetical protein